MTRGWGFRLENLTSVGSAWNPHRLCAKDVELHQRFAAYFSRGCRPTRRSHDWASFETALESSHYDTIHPLTTQGMARSIARSLRKIPALQAQLEGFRV